MTRLAGALLLIALPAFPAICAGEMQIPWSTVAGGGETLGGGGMILTGTVGQPAIGKLAGPGFAHGVGFWCEWVWLPSDVLNPLDLLPVSFSLGPCAPNPFDLSITIRYALPMTTQVTIGVFDVSGRLVRQPVDEIMTAGYRQTVLDGKDLPAGVYFCRMKAGDFEAQRTLVHIK